MSRLRTKLLFRALNKHQTKLSAMEVKEARQYFDKISTTRFKPKVDEVFDTKINSKGHQLKLRIYKSSSAKKPTILFFHGGGFVVGSLNSHDVVARLLLKATNYSVVSVDYRLAPEFTYPAAIEDGVVALDWLVNQQKLGLNSQQIFLAGDSAGGHISVEVATRLTDRLLSHVQGLILMYPALDPALTTDSMQKYAKGHFVTKQNMEYFWKAYSGGQKVTWPITSEKLAKLPATLVQTAEHDILRDEGMLFSQQLTKNGVPNEYHSYKDTAHGLMQMPTVVSKRSKALHDIAKFVDKIIG